MRKSLAAAGLVMAAFVAMGNSGGGCDAQPTAMQNEAAEQQRLSGEALAQTGMPAIKNFREKKLLKDIFELRDQNGLVTYTYLFNQMTGKLVRFCDSVGYGIPYATQYTNPQQDTFYTSSSASHVVLAQPDPNGLYSPPAAEGTWVMCKDPNGKSVQPVYVEPRVIVSPFKLAAE